MQNAGSTPEPRLGRHNRILRDLARSQSGIDDESQLRALTEAAVQSLEVARASIWLYTPQKRGIGCLDLFDANTNEHTSGTELTAADFGPYFRALEAERVIVADDAVTDPATSCFAAVYLVPLGITSMLDAPVRVGGQVVGVLCCEHVGPRRTWSDEDQAAAGSMADFISAVLEGQERRRAERALWESQEQLFHAQKLDAIGRLAGGIAHDFNNMLAVILSYATLLRDGELRPDQREDLGEIVVAAGRAAELTKQLLAFARRQPLTPTHLEVGEVFGSLQKMLVRLIGKDVSLRIDPAGEPLWILADRSRIEQVLTNLVVNARDAMPDGGDIVVSTRADDEHVTLVVSDTGHGMPADVLDKIFEPFFSTKGPGRGTGLGLAIAHGIVEQSGGAIRARSEVGRGTSFEIVLKRVAASEIAFSPPSSEGRSLRGSETVLVVEDNAPLLGLARRSLESYGYRVLTAEGIEDALEVSASFAGKIDMILSDVTMPKANGYVVAEQIRLRRPDIAVLLVSGSSTEEVARSVRGGLECTPVLPKPYTPQQLARTVRAALTPPNGRRSTSAPKSGHTSESAKF